MEQYLTSDRIPPPPLSSLALSRSSSQLPFSRSETVAESEFDRYHLSSILPSLNPPMSSPSSSSSLVRVLGVVQSYDWGKIGRSSSVGELGELGSNLKLDAAKPYAELWMGTHCNGPAKVQLKDGNDEKTITLSEHLGGKDLPFLFKILSVGKSLSIQAHPDMTLAQQLHSTRGNIYKDPFHKPELACALTPFETMCAFRPIEQIRQNIADYPEFADMLGHETVALLQESCEVSPDAKKSALRAMFTAMMTPSEETLKTQLNALLIRLKTAGVQPSVPACDAPTAPTQPTTPLEIGPLMMRLAQQYPGDVGIFAPLYLNAFAMRPGEAIFLGPNEPHAYLSGDCVECMACSDNVVRAGLTPKLRDTEVLINMLTYATHTIESVRMKSQESGNTRIFAPSKEFSEFRLLITELPAESETTLPTLQGASLLLNWSGECQLSTSQSSSSSSLPLTRGQIVCVPNEAQVKVKTGASKVTLFQCAANTQ